MNQHITIYFAPKHNLQVQIAIDHHEKDGGCTFYQNVLRSEIAQKSDWTSFERQA